jgi:ubiquinone/menaquinone biosynthesis C-methylase UbiE
MKIGHAMELIRKPFIESARSQMWCDLGCGGGTFTMALADLLSDGSTIHAVDLDPKALQEIPEKHDGVEILKIVADIGSPSLRLPSVDGILMANSLHYIREQEMLLRRLLSLTDRFLVVEYERSHPNRWGPYPVGFNRLRELFSQVGVERVEKLGTRPSRFGGTIYSAIARGT